VMEEKVRKSEENRISGEECDINKQTIYIAQTSKIESKAHYASESARTTYVKTESSYQPHLLRRLAASWHHSATSILYTDNCVV